MDWLTHTTVFCLLDSLSNNLMLFIKDVCRIRMTSTQPSPTWQWGLKPMGLLEHAHDTFAPFTMKNFPLTVTHPTRERRHINSLNSSRFCNRYYVLDFYFLPFSDTHWRFPRRGRCCACVAGSV